MNRLGLLLNQCKHIAVSSRRKLYTNGLYPYPLKYVTEKVHPAYPLYRETWPDPPFLPKDNRLALWMGRAFWTYIFWMFFNHPEHVFGHFHPPDPSEWTDEELGIPPLEAGSYEDWVIKKSESADSS